MKGMSKMFQVSSNKKYQNKYLQASQGAKAIKRNPVSAKNKNQVENLGQNLCKKRSSAS